jgi:hypothetical protein
MREPIEQRDGELFRLDAFMMPLSWIGWCVGP